MLPIEVRSEKLTALYEAFEQVKAHLAETAPQPEQPIKTEVRALVVASPQDVKLRYAVMWEGSRDWNEWYEAPDTKVDDEFKPAPSDQALIDHLSGLFPGGALLCCSVHNLIQFVFDLDV